MTTVQDIVSFWEQAAPLSYTKDGDNVGLLAGRYNAVVTRVLTALEASFDVIEDAIEKNAQLLLVHHPILFTAKAVNDTDYNGRRLLRLLENRIACLCLHTNVDAAPGGINDLLAEICMLTEPVPLCSATKLGRVGMLTEEKSAAQYAAEVAKALGCQQMRYVDGGRPLRRVAVGSGNSTSQFEQAVQAGCDAFVTGDIRHHMWQEARDMGFTLLDAGHFETEAIIAPVLAARTQAAFPTLDVLVSERMKPPFEVL